MDTLDWTLGSDFGMDDHSSCLTLAEDGFDVEPNGGGRVFVSDNVNMDHKVPMNLFPNFVSPHVSFYHPHAMHHHYATNTMPSHIDNDNSSINNNNNNNNNNGGAEMGNIWTPSGGEGNTNGMLRCVDWTTTMMDPGMNAGGNAGLGEIRPDWMGHGDGIVSSSFGSTTTTTTTTTTTAAAAVANTRPKNGRFAATGTDSGNNDPYLLNRFGVALMSPFVEQPPISPVSSVTRSSSDSSSTSASTNSNSSRDSASDEKRNRNRNNRNRNSNSNGGRSSISNCSCSSSNNSNGCSHCNSDTQSWSSADNQGPCLQAVVLPVGDALTLSRAQATYPWPGYHSYFPENEGHLMFPYAAHHSFASVNNNIFNWQTENTTKEHAVPNEKDIKAEPEVKRKRGRPKSLNPRRMPVQRSKDRSELTFSGWYSMEDSANVRNRTSIIREPNPNSKAKGFQRGGVRTEFKEAGSESYVNDFYNKPPPSNAAYARIRVWKDTNDRKYYDCLCNCRKPVQDLTKIKRHVLSHDQRNFQCDICGRIFHNNHLQLNAHKKTHKKIAKKRKRVEMEEILEPTKF